MPKITTNEAFREALSSLTLAQQRAVSARFIENVLDLAHESCIKQAQAILGKIDEISAEELEKAYHATHSVYVHTYPRSDLSLLDYKQQAEHFVADACTALHQRITTQKSITWLKGYQPIALWRGPAPALIIKVTIQSSRRPETW
jgi:hypothetical protein